MFAKLVILTLLAHSVTASTDGALTCDEVKQAFTANECCGNPSKEITTLALPSEAPAACPYNFDKPSCADAGVQAPRDVSAGAVGLKAATFSPLNYAQGQKLYQTNIHFHLGAEHKSDGQYDHVPVAPTRRLEGDAVEHDHAGEEVAHDPTDAHSHHDIEDVEKDAGWMCDTTGMDVSTPYTFEYCQDVEVGKTYEIHFVHSSAGTEVGGDPYLTDGLGQAANGRQLLNPFVTVQAQVFVITNDGTTIDDMVHGWDEDLVKLATADGLSPVAYAGSTTGPSHTNEVCSPYAVTWHVDRMCHPVSAASWDKMCNDMIQMYGMHADVWPHGSRELVAQDFVVPDSEVVEFQVP